jgi:hypothetical protein
MALGDGAVILAWYVFAPQCMSTLAVVRRETGRWLWPVVMFVYMIALAYGAAFLVYRLRCRLGPDDWLSPRLAMISFFKNGRTRAAPLRNRRAVA